MVFTTIRLFEYVIYSRAALNRTVREYMAYANKPTLLTDTSDMKLCSFDGDWSIEHNDTTFLTKFQELME